MHRNPSTRRAALVAASLLAVIASGAAMADDNSMSMWTGESYAYFNNQDYSLGKFNTAHAPRDPQPSSVAESPAKERVRAERRILLANGPTSSRRTNPFRDDTGA